MNLHFIQPILCLLMLTAGAFAFAATPGPAAETSEPVPGDRIYRTRDEHGRAVFSDQAPENAEEVKVERPMTFPAGEFARDYERATRRNEPPAPGASPPYTEIRITYPENDSAIRQNDGNITLAFVLAPGLRSGHALKLLLDGAEYAAVRSPAPVQMPNLDRGTHQVQLKIVDVQTGKVVQEGEPVSFTVLRHSVLH